MRVQISKSPRSRGWLRAVLGGAVVTTLSILATPGSSVQAVDYDFVSVYSSATTLGDFNATTPAVNNAGTVAFVALIPDPVANRSSYIVFRSGGGQLVALLNLTDALGAGSPGPVVINDSGAIALHYGRGIESLVVRIQTDGSYIVMARADQLASTPYLEIAPAIAMNAGGQVAALVTNPDLTSSIVRLDGAGAVEVARSSPALRSFSAPGINDAGVVAFTAQPSSATNVHVYTGTGGSLTDEGAVEPCPGPSHAPVINNDGLVLSDCGGLPLFTARGGLVSVLLAGGEDAIFGRLTSGYSLSNRARPVFATGSTETPGEVGLFTGNDPASNKVVRTGDTVFELPVEDIAIGALSVNDTGQIAFLLQVGGESPATHIILATPRRTPQEITFPDLASTIFGSPPVPVTATSTSGLPVTFTASGACALAAGVVTLLGAGSCSITASQAGDSTYLPATDVIRTLAILRAPQSIDFGPVAGLAFGAQAFAVSATATSGLSVGFAASGPCAVAGSLVTLAGAGACTLVASQGGSADYEPAVDVARSFTIGRAGQTIAVAPLADRTFGDPPFAVEAAASSALPVSFAAGGSCTIAGALVTPGGGGSCVVTASQGGNADYEPAPDVARAFTIAAAGQTITFAALPDRTFGDPPFTVTATASSGLAVRFTATGGCAVAGDLVSITGAGGCSVTASQPGDANYLPAPDVTQGFAVARAAQTIDFGALPSFRLGDPPMALTAVASSGLPVAFSASGACTVSENLLSLIAVGSCTVTASQAGNANFEAAASVARSLSVSGVILESRFDVDPDGFDYVDNPFRGTNQGLYASGNWLPTGGFRGGRLSVSLGGIDNNTIRGMSGGWQRKFTLAASTRVMLYLRANLTQSPYYEPDEKSELLVSIDGVLRAGPPSDYVAQIVGNGNSGGSITTGWKLYTLNLGALAAGTHTLVIGSYNSQKTLVDESTTLLIDDVVMMETGAGARAAVDTLDFDRFKDNIRVLAGFGDRTQGSASNIAAGQWLETQLKAAGYVVQRHRFTYNGQPRDNIYVTKVGTRFPDQMYIVSAHMDGRGGGGAANDDASGCSLVLEAARGLAGLPTAVSVRFIFWNNEETGLNGSKAYVSQKLNQQGIESPLGSGNYPEPRWLGMIQHDQILFDHGLPPQPNQIPNADIDVEYQASTTYALQSQQLALALRAGNQTYSVRYPAQVGSNMNFTDSVPFQNYTATVSVRDNQRVAEIGNGSNPHWHQPTDVYTAFSEDDFQLGFNAVQMTLGTVAELAGTTLP